MISKTSFLLIIILYSLQKVSSQETTTNSAKTTSAPKNDKTSFKKSLWKECGTKYTFTCLKLDMVSWVDSLDKEDHYSVFPGVTIVRENTSVSADASTPDVVAELAKSFPSDADTRIDLFLLNKITSYLRSRSIRLNLWNNNDENIGTGRGKGGGGGGGGGGKGGGGGGGHLLAAGAMMKATLYAIALSGIAAIAGKALMTALISLVLSAIIGLKSLTHHGHKQTTYEIVSKPVYTHENTHSVSHESHGHGGGFGHSSYGRSFEIPIPKGLQPEYEQFIKNSK